MWSRALKVARIMPRPASPQESRISELSTSMLPTGRNETIFPSLVNFHSITSRLWSLKSLLPDADPDPQVFPVVHIVASKTGLHR